MATKPLTDEQCQDALDAVERHGSIAEAARVLGMPPGTFRNRWLAGTQRGLKPNGGFSQQAVSGQGEQLAETTEVKGDTCQLTKNTHERVMTLADLIRVCEIDTAVWEVERYVCNKWEVGAKVEDEMTVRPLFQVKAWLKKRVDLINAREEIAALVAAAKKQIPARPAVKVPTAGTGHMLHISIPDLHLGKLAWEPETGWDNYDIRTAERVHDEALDALIRRTASYRFDVALIVLGNDLFHSDTKQGTTTAGTVLDTDSRYQKTFVTGRQMAVRGIERLRTIAPVVRVVLCPGNHDTLSVWHLGDSLECYYHATPSVQIDNTPRMRKYVQHGSVMLMFTHGNKGKLERYPQVMAAEQPEMWGSTIFREAHTGDKHHLRVQEHHGVRVRISPALCPPDAWHSENMFVGAQRSAEAFVWNKDEGLVGTAWYTVPHHQMSRGAAA